jgi:hypothetical protein
MTPVEASVILAASTSMLIFSGSGASNSNIWAASTGTAAYRALAITSATAGPIAVEGSKFASSSSTRSASIVAFVPILKSPDHVAAMFASSEVKDKFATMPRTITSPSGNARSSRDKDPKPTPAPTAETDSGMSVKEVFAFWKPWALLLPRDLIYWHGTIGAAKKDLDKRVVDIREKLAVHSGDARVSVLKAVVTQASAAIPAMPIYLAILFKVMKARGTHEGCIEQVDRLFRDSLYGEAAAPDAEGRLRADDLELDPEVQAEVAQRWAAVNTENLSEQSDFQGYKREFLQLFGFEVEGVDYEADVDPVVPIANLVE